MQGISSPVHNKDELYHTEKVMFRVKSNSVIMYPSIYVSKKVILVHENKTVRLR